MSVLFTGNARRTQAFYDTYWPSNVPDFSKTKEHVHEVVPAGRYERALDGGCGSGACSLALADLAETVVGVDLSLNCARTALGLSEKTGARNVDPCQGSLLSLPFPS